MNKQSYRKRQISHLVLAIFLFGAVVSVGMIVLKMFFDSRVVFSTDWYYPFLRWGNQNKVLLVITVTLLGIILILFRSYWKALGLTEEIYASLNKVSEKNDAYISFKQNEPLMTKRMNEVKTSLRQKEKEAQDNERRKNELIMYLAHDIKTPLTSVIGFLSILKEENDLSLDFQKKYLQISFDKALRLEELTNEFFDITRFNLDNLVLQKESVDYGFMVQQIISEFYPLLQEKELNVESKIKIEEHIMIDSNKIARVLDNILRNAIIYAYPSTTIHVDVSQQENKILTSIKNEGPSIPAKKLDRIFDEFFRMDAARSTDHDGAGLGLAIAKNIVTAHDGEICASNVEKDIMISFSLPIKS